MLASHVHYSTSSAAKHQARTHCRNAKLTHHSRSTHNSPHPHAPRATAEHVAESQIQTDLLLKETKVCVFSAQQYVVDFLSAPLLETFPESLFLEVIAMLMLLRIFNGMRYYIYLSS